MSAAERLARRWTERDSARLREHLGWQLCTDGTKDKLGTAVLGLCTLIAMLGGPTKFAGAISAALRDPGVTADTKAGALAAVLGYWVMTQDMLERRQDEHQGRLSKEDVAARLDALLGDRERRLDERERARLERAEEARKRNNRGLNAKDPEKRKEQRRAAVRRYAAKKRAARKGPPV